MYWVFKDISFIHLFQRFHFLILLQFFFFKKRYVLCLEKMIIQLCLSNFIHSMFSIFYFFWILIAVVLS